MIQGYILLGRIYPSQRMTQKGQWVKANAIKHKACKADLKLQYRTQFNYRDYRMFPEKTPLGVFIYMSVNERTHIDDMENKQKMAIDSAQGIVLKDDKYVDFIQVRRDFHPDQDPLCLMLFGLKQEFTSIWLASLSFIEPIRKDLAL